MGGAYGGFIIMINYGGIDVTPIIDNLFLWLDNTPFTLLDNEFLTLL